MPLTHFPTKTADSIGAEIQDRPRPLGRDPRYATNAQEYERLKSVVIELAGLLSELEAAGAGPGGVKLPVQVVTTEDVDLGTALAAGQEVNGRTLVMGWRVLVPAQDDATENGIYIVTATVPTRAPDLFTGAAAGGVLVVVQDGDASGDTLWMCTNDIDEDIVGTNELVFTTDGEDCCAALGAYSAQNFTPTAATPVGQLEGIDNKLADLGAQAVSVDADGVLDHASADEVGSLLEIEVNKAAGDYVAEQTDVTETAAPGTANKLKVFSVGGTPKLSIASSGAATIHNPGTDAAPALQVDRGSGGAVGITNPADSQLGLVANDEKLILDNSGANPTLLPDDDLTWDLAAAGARIRRAFIQTLVDPLIAAVADPVDQAISFVLASLTAARTITMPDANVVLHKNNIAATAAPVAGDDDADGYSVGSIWINTTADAAYLCVDASTGAAVWINVGGSSSLRAPLILDATAATAFALSDANVAAEHPDGLPIGDLLIIEVQAADSAGLVFTPGAAADGSAALICVRNDGVTTIDCEIAEGAVPVNVGTPLAFSSGAVVGLIWSDGTVYVSLYQGA